MNNSQQPTPLVDTDAVFQHAQRLAAPQPPPEGFNGEPMILVPKGWDAKSVPGWERDEPQRIRTTVNLGTAESFARYVNDFKSTETRIFAEIGNEIGKITAILDYHGGVPGWCQHRAVFVPQIAEEWKRWREVDRKRMSQEAFALFLEDNLSTVRQPDGADLLQIINTIEVDGKVEFRSAQKTQNGTVRFAFTNEQRAKSGELEVPAEFTLAMPVFEEEQAFEIQARLRYRLAGGEFGLWFEMVNPHRTVRDALAMVVNRVHTATAIAPLRGIPPA
jgi:uncharacterized protein YfdQ (DUF2303 family)